MKISTFFLFGNLLGLFSGITAITYDLHGLYFVQDTGAPVVIDRLDPIMTPGSISPHEHTIIGSNAFAPTMNFAITQKTTCSTVIVKADKSVYWFPTLYFQDPKNQSFIRVPERPEHKIYYFNRAQQNETIEAFPKDFRMIAGDQKSRSLASTIQAQSTIEWFCHDPDTKASGFPGGFTSCRYGFAGSIHFPHCWNGQAFDISNPKAHMSYPMGDHPDSGYCPESHPNVLPHIFVENWYDVDMFNGLYDASDKPPWVLSSGDPTGFGYHGDFINGWEPKVLQEAITTCRIGESGDPLSDCFDVYTDDERTACEIDAVVLDDKVGWLDHLPGCNPIQAGPQDAVAPTCNWSYISSLDGQTTPGARPTSQEGEGSGAGSVTVHRASMAPSSLATATAATAATVVVSDTSDPITALSSPLSLPSVDEAASIPPHEVPIAGHSATETSQPDTTPVPQTDKAGSSTAPKPAVAACGRPSKATTKSSSAHPTFSTGKMNWTDGFAGRRKLHWPGKHH